MDVPSAGLSRVAVGFFQGVGALVRGIGFICGKPRNWGYASVPAVVCVVLVGLFGAGGIFLVQHFSQGFMDSRESGWGTAAGWAMRVVLWLISVLLAVLVVLAVLGVLLYALVRFLHIRLVFWAKPESLRASND